MSCKLSMIMCLACITTLPLHLRCYPSIHHLPSLCTVGWLLSWLTLLVWTPHLFFSSFAPCLTNLSLWTIPCPWSRSTDLPLSVSFSAFSPNHLVTNYAMFFVHCLFLMHLYVFYFILIKYLILLIYLKTTRANPGKLGSDGHLRRTLMTPHTVLYWLYVCIYKELSQIICYVWMTHSIGRTILSSTIPMIC